MFMMAKLKNPYDYINFVGAPILSKLFFEGVVGRNNKHFTKQWCIYMQLMPHKLLFRMKISFSMRAAVTTSINSAHVLPFLTAV